MAGIKIMMRIVFTVHGHHIRKRYGASSIFFEENISIFLQGEDIQGIDDA
jgi:hypothetical protein